VYLGSVASGTEVSGGRLQGEVKWAVKLLCSMKQVKQCTYNEHWGAFVHPLLPCGSDN